MTDVLAVANQKGGVAKTTTVHSLGVASAELGRRTLVVDLDPQACLTFSLGFDPDALESSLHDVFVRRQSVAEVALPVPGVPGLDVPGWQAFFAPARTPQGIVDALNSAVVRSLADPDLKAQIAKGLWEASSSTPAELQRIVRADYERWGAVFHDIGIKPQ